MAQRTLTLYLGKNDLTEFEEALTEEAQSKIGLPTTRVVDAPDFGDGARLYVFVGQNHTPRWLTEVRQHFSVPGQITTSSAAGVLLFRSAGRGYVRSSKPEPATKPQPSSMKSLVMIDLGKLSS
jgi:uncharacterized protein (TIGR04141 family)